MTETSKDRKGPAAARKALQALAEARWAKRRTRPARARTLRVVAATANVGRAAGTDRTRAYLEQIASGVPRGRDLTVVMFQEIGAGDIAHDELGLVKEAFPRSKGWHTEALDTQEPMVWRGNQVDWRRRGGTAVVRTMSGIAGYSPGRKTGTTLLRGVGVDCLVSTIGGHYPAGAYNGYRPAAVKARLVEGWNAHHAGVKAAIRLARRAEADVIVGMDVNRRNSPRWHRGQVLGTPRGVIDRLALIPGRGREAELMETGELENGVGEGFHPCRWASYEVRLK